MVAAAGVEEAVAEGTAGAEDGAAAKAGLFAEEEDVLDSEAGFFFHEQVEQPGHAGFFLAPFRLTVKRRR